MNNILAASFLLVARCCLIDGHEGSASSALDVALKPLYSQLETFKMQLDAIKLLVRCDQVIYDQGGYIGDCSSDDQQALGMEDGRIPDDAITASSVWTSNIAVCGPQRARLNMNGYASAWCAASSDSTPWIQVDFSAKVYITGLITQGRADAEQWVTEYQVAYSDDGQSWDQVTADETPTTFTGNTDRNTLVTASFSPVLQTKYLRIIPTDWHGWSSLRFEVMGCNQ